MYRFIQNMSDASASRSPVVHLHAVDYGLLAMLLVTLVAFGATVAGN